MRAVGLWAGDQSEMVALALRARRSSNFAAVRMRRRSAARSCSDGGEDDDGEQKGEEAGEEAGELDEHAVCRLAKGEFDLLPHELISLAVLLGIALLVRTFC